MSTETETVTELVLVDVVLIDAPGLPVQAEIVRDWTPPTENGDFPEPLALRILPGQSYHPDTITYGCTLQHDTSVGEDPTATAIRIRRDQLHLAADLLLAGWKLECI